MAGTKRVRRELATAFRWAARLGLNESIANHFSAAVSDDGARFLINPRGMHFEQISASDLVVVESGEVTDSSRVAVDRGVDPTAWILHGHLHAAVPRARCVLHTHMPYATTLACLRDFRFLMLDQNACRFHERIAYDRDYQGMALDPDEGRRVASLLGDDKDVLFLGNHGVIVVGPSVAEAFDDLYYLERAAQLQVLAMSTGRDLHLIDDALAATVCRQWREYPEFSRLHLRALMSILDEEESDYAA